MTLRLTSSSLAGTSRKLVAVGHGQAALHVGHDHGAGAADGLAGVGRRGASGAVTGAMGAVGAAPAGGLAAARRTAAEARPERGRRGGDGCGRLER